MKISVKRDTCSVVLALLFDSYALYCGIKILLKGHGLGSVIPFILIVAAIFYASELGFLHYTLDEAGLHQHYLFHTVHSPWNSFTSITIEQGENYKKGIQVVCFNRGIIDLGSQHVNVGLHPIRYHAICIEGESEDLRRFQQKWGNTALMSKAAFLELMESCGIPVRNA